MFLTIISTVCRGRHSSNLFNYTLTRNYLSFQQVGDLRGVCKNETRQKRDNTTVATIKK